jgi:hypothetical protein
MTPLKDILGKPGEGIHFHLFGVAVVDVLGTILLGCLLGWLYWWKYSKEDYPVGWMAFFTVWLFFLGEALHLLIGVDTTVALWIRRTLK